jgi:hypothetical protein
MEVGVVIFLGIRVVGVGGALVIVLFWLGVVWVLFFVMRMVVLMRVKCGR